MAIVETSFPRGGVVRSKAKETEIVSLSNAFRLVISFLSQNISQFSYSILVP